MPNALIAVSSALVTVLLSGSPEPISTEIAPELQEVREIRSVQLVSADDGAMTFPKDQPGLHLGFEVEVPGKNGPAKVVGFNQPSSITATDNVGADLTGIEESFGGEKVFVEREHKWEETEPEAFTLHLSEPRRQAETFSVSATFDAVVFDETKSYTVALPQGQEPLDPAIAGVEGATVEFKKTNSGCDLVFVPGSVYDRFEKVRVFAGQDEMEQGWAMWSEMSASVSFQGEVPAGARVEFVVRDGLRTVPVRVSIVDHKLP